MQRAWQQHKHHDQAQHKQHHARIQEQPLGAVDEQKLQMPPAIPEAAQMRRTGTAIRRQRRGHLRHFQMHQRGLHHHLAGILHTGRLQIQLLNAFLIITAQAAVEIADIAGIKQTADKRQHRVADIAVQRRHGPFRNTTLETVAHHQLIAFPQLLQKRHQVQKIIAVICIAHDHIFSIGCITAADQRSSVALHRHMYQPGSTAFCDLLGAVRAAVVRDQHLAVYMILLQEVKRPSLYTPQAFLPRSGRA